MKAEGHHATLVRHAILALHQHDILALRALHHHAIPVLLGHAILTLLHLIAGPSFVAVAMLACHHVQRISQGFSYLSSY